MELDRSGVPRTPKPPAVMLVTVAAGELARTVSSSRAMRPKRHNKPARDWSRGDGSMDGLPCECSPPYVVAEQSVLASRSPRELVVAERAPESAR